MTHNEVMQEMWPYLQAIREAEGRIADHATVLVAMVQAECAPGVVANNEYVVELRGHLYSRASAMDALRETFKREPVAVAEILRELAIQVKGITGKGGI